jgi:hypothetical protein
MPLPMKRHVNDVPEDPLTFLTETLVVPALFFVLAMAMTFILATICIFAAQGRWEMYEMDKRTLQLAVLGENK